MGRDLHYQNITQPEKAANWSVPSFSYHLETCCITWLLLGLWLKGLEAALERKP